MLRTLLLSLIAATAGTTAYAHEGHDHGTVTETDYAIANPQRPGAKAPYCEAQKETVDGCTFHSVAGGTYSARLLTAPGETWVARASDGQIIHIQPLQEAEVEKGQRYQIIQLAPKPLRNADETVTFDKLTGEGDASKVVERRRITVMIHPA